MSLADSIEEVRGTGIAAENRVKILLRRLEGTADHDTLRSLLTDKSNTSAFITRVLRHKYGHDVVKNLSVAAYRREHMDVQVTGL